MGIVLTKAKVHVHSSSSALQGTEGLDDGLGHTVLGLVDVEVAQGAVLRISIHRIHIAIAVTLVRSRIGAYRWVWAPQYLSPGTCLETQLETIHKAIAKCG